MGSCTSCSTSVPSSGCHTRVMVHSAIYSTEQDACPSARWPAEEAFKAALFNRVYYKPLQDGHLVKVLWIVLIQTRQKARKSAQQPAEESFQAAFLHRVPHKPFQDGHLGQSIVDVL